MATLYDVAISIIYSSLAESSEVVKNTVVVEPSTIMGSSPLIIIVKLIKGSPSVIVIDVDWKFTSIPPVLAIRKHVATIQLQ